MKENRFNSRNQVIYKFNIKGWISKKNIFEWDLVFSSLVGFVEFAIFKYYLKKKKKKLKAFSNFSYMHI